MTIEVTNSSGQLVPSAEVTSLLTFAMGELKLNPECESDLSPWHSRQALFLIGSAANAAADDPLRARKVAANRITTYR